MKKNKNAKPSPRIYIFTVITLLIINLLVRLWGITFTGFGDEVKVIAPAIEIARNHNLFTVLSYYPYAFINFLSLVFYLPAKLCPNCSYVFFLHLGRIISTILAVLSGLILFFLVKKNYKNNTLALLTLLLFSLFPLHVKFSHYSFTEGFLSFFSLITLYFSANVAKDGNKKDLLLASIAAGIATATKYPGVVNIFITALSYFIYFLSQRKKTPILIFKLCKAVLLIGVISLTAFSIAAYQNVLDIKSTYRIVAELQIRHNQGDLGVSSKSWLFNLASPSLEPDLALTYASFVTNMGWIMTTTFIVGFCLLAYASFKNKNSSFFILSSFFVILFYSFVNISSQTKGIKYYMPLFPFIIPPISFVLYTFLSNKNKIIKTFGILYTCSIVYISISQIYVFLKVLSTKSSILQAQEWATQHIKKNSIVIQFAAIPVINPLDQNFTVIEWQNKYKHTFPHSNEIIDDRAPKLSYWKTKYHADYIILNGRHYLKYSDAEVQKRYPEMTASYLSFFKELNEKTTLIKYWQTDPANNKYNWPEIKIYKISK